MGTVLIPGRSERELDRAESAKASAHLSSPHGNFVKQASLSRERGCRKQDRTHMEE